MRRELPLHRSSYRYDAVEEVKGGRGVGGVAGRPRSIVAGRTSIIHHHQTKKNKPRRTDPYAESFSKDGPYHGRHHPRTCVAARMCRRRSRWTAQDRGKTVRRKEREGTGCDWIGTSRFQNTDPGGRMSCVSAWHIRDSAKPHMTLAAARPVRPRTARGERRQREDERVWPGTWGHARRQRDPDGLLLQTCRSGRAPQPLSFPARKTGI